MGFVLAADIAVSVEHAKFGFSEARLEAPQTRQARDGRGDAHPADVRA